MMTKTLRFTAFLFVLLYNSVSFCTGSSLERCYQAGVVPLVSSHEYLRSHPAPTYWTLSSYYIGQRDENSCSLACATMVVNSLILMKDAVQPDRATQETLLERIDGGDVWAEKMTDEGPGVSLDELVGWLKSSFHAFSIDEFKIRAVHVQQIDHESKKALLESLRDIEKEQSLMIVNALQSTFLRDEGCTVGHFVVIGAFDEKKKAVLICDPDRSICEPYWVNIDLLLKGMNTIDTDSHQYRGYIVVDAIIPKAA